MLTTAVIDKTGMYRYSLIREWDREKSRILFVMLNPSTADATQDDPTIRRCIGLAKAWQHGCLEVCNLFAYRATNPDELRKVADPVGPENNSYLTNAICRARVIVVAWGTKGNFNGRDREFWALVKSIKYLKNNGIFCLDETKDGHPRHPLYVSNQVVPKIYRPKHSLT